MATEKQIKKAEAEGRSTAQLVKQLESWTVKEKEIIQKEKEQPWNVDTISEESFRYVIVYSEYKQCLLNIEKLFNRNSS